VHHDDVTMLVHDDVTINIQKAQEESIQHAKEALGMTESTLNGRLLALEKELNNSQVCLECV